MGRATIVEGGEDGLYTVSVDYGIEIIQQRSNDLQSKISDRQSELEDAQDELDEAQSAVNLAALAVDSAIATYRSTLDPTDLAALNKKNANLLRASSRRNQSGVRRSMIQAQIADLQGQLSQLQAVRVNEVREAWCADFTENAEGEVATIEIPGEIGSMIIAPAGREPANDDGRLVARGAQFGHQVFYNAAVLPGWQRFKHPYRVGTLAFIEGNEGTVVLDAATSSANDLQVRDEETITAPIEYMTCNASAFEDGDRVVVDMRGPVIVGFESNPRPCGAVWAHGWALDEGGSILSGPPVTLHWKAGQEEGERFASSADWVVNKLAVHKRRVFEAADGGVNPEFGTGYFRDREQFASPDPFIHRVNYISANSQSVITASNGLHSGVSSEDRFSTLFTFWNPDTLTQQSSFEFRRWHSDDGHELRAVAAGRDRIIIIAANLTGQTQRNIIWLTMGGAVVRALDARLTPTLRAPDWVAAWGDEYAVAYDTWEEGEQNPEYGSLSFVRIFDRNGLMTEQVGIPGTETPPWPLIPTRISGIALTKTRLFVARAYVPELRDIVELDRTNDYAPVATYSKLPPGLFEYVPFSPALDASNMPG